MIKAIIRFSAENRYLVIAATIALSQTDIKRVIAYSTMSHIGYMIMAVSVSAYAAGMFHLFTHAFFKALLFLAAGSVMHAMGGVIDMRRFSGLRKIMPTTNAARNTYGRDDASVLRDTSPIHTTTTIAIGTWNAKPNASSMPPPPKSATTLSGASGRS